MRWRKIDWWDIFESSVDSWGNVTCFVSERLGHAPMPFGVTRIILQKFQDEDNEDDEDTDTRYGKTPEEPKNLRQIARCKAISTAMRNNMVMNKDDP